MNIAVDSGVPGSDGHIYFANLGEKFLLGRGHKDIGVDSGGVGVRFLKI